MFSLPQQPTPSLIFINLVLLFSVFLLQKQSLRFPFIVPKPRRLLSIVLMFVFILFSFWGQDWFHYLEAYPNLCLGERGHMEEVYVWIAQHLSVGYISFRFAVWGTGFILLLLTIERLPLKKDLILLFFGSIWIIWFSYARVSLGLALVFWGLAVLYYPYRSSKFLSRILAIAAIAVSFIFHKSTFVLVIAAVLTILSLRLKRQLFILLIVISIPFIVLYIRNNIVMFFMLDADANEGSLGQAIVYGQRYLGSKSKTGGVGLSIADWLGSTPYYLLLIQSILLTIKPGRYKEPKVVQSFIRLFIILVFIATLFSLNLGVNSSILFYRFLRFAAFPSAVLLAYYWEYNYYPKLTRWTFLLAALSALYSVSYSFYCSL